MSINRSIGDPYETTKLFTYRTVNDLGLIQLQNKEILRFFQNDQNQYISNAILLNKKEPTEHDYMFFQGEEYLILEQYGTEGSIDVIGIKKPEISDSNISIMTYLFGDKVKDAIEKIMIRMALYKNVNFFIIGSGPLRKDIELLAKANHVEDRVFIINQLNNPYQLISYCDFFIPVPNGRLNELKWKRNSVCVSGYIYVPGFNQETETVSQKTLIFKDKDNNLVHKIEMDNQYTDWLSEHSNHGNNILNYDYAGFEKLIQFKDIMLPTGEYYLFISIYQDGKSLDIPFINSIQKKIPKRCLINKVYYEFLEIKDLNRQISLKVYES
jgi:hypothetical protein